MDKTSANSKAIDYKSIAKSKDCKEGEKVLIGRVESISSEKRIRGNKVVRSITFEFLYPCRDYKITGTATLTEENRYRFNIREGDEVYLFASKAEVGYFIECGSKIDADEDTKKTSAGIIEDIKQTPKYGGKPLVGEERKQKMAIIVDGWRSMKGIEDLCVVLNIALQVLYGNDAVKTFVDRLKFLACNGRYVTFKIPKKKEGEYRTIDAPCSELKSVQQALNLILQEVYSPNAAAMGFVKGKSVVTNAQVHLGQNFVYNIDLKDFFPSVTSGRLYRRLLAKPFCLKEEVASIISDLCCYTKCENKVLPQGAPTSPILTNIICERMDIKLTRLAKAYGLKYTRYADDITFSGVKNFFAEDGKFCSSMRNIIEKEEGFVINPDKTRLSHRGMRQEVTGITVNNKINVSRKYVKQLRPLIHNWEVKGYDEAQSIFAEQYARTNTRNHKFKGQHHIENIIMGKLLYLKMVKGETDSVFKALNNRFEKLYLAKFAISNTLIDKSLLSSSIDDNFILSELNNLVALIENNKSE